MSDSIDSMMRRKSHYNLLAGLISGVGVCFIYLRPSWYTIPSANITITIWEVRMIWGSVWAEMIPLRAQIATNDVIIFFSLQIIRRLAHQARIRTPIPIWLS